MEGLKVGVLDGWKVKKLEGWKNGRLEDEKGGRFGCRKVGRLEGWKRLEDQNIGILAQFDRTRKQPNHMKKNHFQRILSFFLFLEGFWKRLED